MLCMVKVVSTAQTGRFSASCSDCRCLTEVALDVVVLHGTGSVVPYQLHEAVNTHLILDCRLNRGGDPFKIWRDYCDVTCRIPR